VRQNIGGLDHYDLVEGGDMHDRRPEKITREYVDTIVEEGKQLGINNPLVSRYGAHLIKKLSIPHSYIDKKDMYDLRQVVERHRVMAKKKGFDKIEAFRPQPSEGLDLGNIKLPFEVFETKTPFSLSEELLCSAVTISGALRSGKSSAAGHLLKSVLNNHKAVVGFDSKGVGEWDFLALKHPVLLLTVGESGEDGFYFNPFTDELGIADILNQLEILAICTQRKDARGLLIHAAKYFLENRRKDDDSQLTLSKIYKILTSEITPATHKYLFRQQLWPSLLNVIESLLSSPLGHSLKVERGLDFRRLIEAGGSVFINSSAITLQYEGYLIASVGWKIYETVRQYFAN